MGIESVFAKMYFLQNMVIRAVASVPPAVEHNLGKIYALKRAFFHCYMEHVEGDYVEFGVFEGTSLLSAFIMDQRVNKEFKRKFFGFDSFEGFRIKESSDRHPFFEDGGLKGDYEFVQRRLAKAFKDKAEFQLVKGYYDDVLKGKTPTDFGITRAAVVLIDCDLKTSSQAALDFIGPSLVEGAIIILDDYFAYKGNQDKGVAAAFQTFMKANEHIHFRLMSFYEQGGAVFVVSKIVP
jgi:hypothetical protein